MLQVLVETLSQFNQVECQHTCTSTYFRDNCLILILSLVQFPVRVSFPIQVSTTCLSMLLLILFNANFRCSYQDGSNTSGFGNPITLFVSLGNWSCQSNLLYDSSLRNHLLGGWNYSCCGTSSTSIQLCPLVVEDGCWSWLIRYPFFDKVCKFKNVKDDVTHNWLSITKRLFHFQLCGFHWIRPPCNCIYLFDRHGWQECYWTSKQSYRCTEHCSVPLRRLAPLGTACSEHVLWHSLKGLYIFCVISNT